MLASDGSHPIETFSEIPAQRLKHGGTETTEYRGNSPWTLRYFIAAIVARFLQGQMMLIDRLELCYLGSQIRDYVFHDVKHDDW